MEDYFIEKIIIKDVRDIKNLEIYLDKEKRKHLIITGKNGCGKTSTLLEINNLLNKLINNGFITIENNKKHIEDFTKAILYCEKNIKKYKDNIKIQKANRNKIINTPNTNQKILQIDNNIKSYKSNILTEENNIINYKRHIKNYKKEIDEFSKIDLVFSNQDKIYSDIVSRKFILAYFQAKRENKPRVATSIQNINLNPNYNTDTNSLHTKFIEYMVKLRVDMLDAKEENETNEVKRIEKWFSNFEKSLKEIFGVDDLKLKYYRKELNFKIEYNGKSFGLNELSDGYSSLLAILTELILRMEAHAVNAYDMQGVVLIDEIETHLHVSLQKKVLPFLTSFFKNIQFIVTTHSPFVLQSIENSIVYDLERKEQLNGEKLVNASYTEIVKSYFEVGSEFSKVLTTEIEKYESLIEKFEKNTLDIEGEKELLELDIKLDKIAPMLSDTIYLRFKEAQDRINND